MNGKFNSNDQSLDCCKINTKFPKSLIDLLKKADLHSLIRVCNRTPFAKPNGEISWLKTFTFSYSVISYSPCLSCK